MNEQELNLIDWPKPRVLLLGGTSHSGKTSLAERIAAKPGWVLQSTDKLAKHPGRPWKSGSFTPPPHVQQHYQSLNVEALLDDVIRHYNRLWPMIEKIIADHIDSAAPEQHSLVIEGSALWPTNVLKFNSTHARAFWLEVSPEVTQQRIYANSDYENSPVEGKYLVDKFLQRTLKFDNHMKAQLGKHKNLLLTDRDLARLVATL